LTLAEIRKITESFRFTLINMLHSRIAYPKREEKDSPASAIRGEQKSAA
jgi:membrane-associated HD superfamily phosphohydrolase